jgi:hypothetical protein
MQDGDIVERDGRYFRVNIKRDDCGDTPWQRDDGHGPVSDWTRRNKAPSERVLCSDRSSKRYYNFAEAVRIARRDWVLPGIIDGKTAGQRAHEAVEADFERLRRWCADQWEYVGVVVTPLADEDDGCKTDYQFALWGIESDCGEYIAEMADELIDEALASTRITQAVVNRVESISA